MTSMRQGQIEKIHSIRSFFVSLLDATAPFFHENLLPQKLQNVRPKQANEWPKQRHDHDHVLLI